jgi:hypothetical protein
VSAGGSGSSRAGDQVPKAAHPGMAGVGGPPDVPPDVSDAYPVGPPMPLATSSWLLILPSGMSTLRIAISGPHARSYNAHKLQF